MNNNEHLSLNIKLALENLNNGKLLAARKLLEQALFRYGEVTKAVHDAFAIELQGK